MDDLSFVRFVHVAWQKVSNNQHDCTGWVKKHPLKSFAYISVCDRPPQTKIYPVVCHLYPHQFYNFGPLICTFLKTATLCNINPWIITVCFMLLQHSKTSFLKQYLYITWNHTVKVFVRNCYVSDQILCSKCLSVSFWYTGLESVVEILHTFSNGFLRQGSPDSLQSLLQFENCFGFWLQLMVSF